ncbi:unnamed protein product [Cunninghamella blakesleeana]
MTRKKTRKTNSDVSFEEVCFLYTPTSNWTNTDLQNYNIKVTSINNFPKYDTICRVNNSRTLIVTLANIFSNIHFKLNVVKSQKITPKTDFGVRSKFNNSVMLVLEDRTMIKTNFSNSWKEALVISEMFVAFHNKDLKTVYSVRVVYTLFTFYKSTIDYNYKITNLRLGKYLTISFED